MPDSKLHQEFSLSSVWQDYRTLEKAALPRPRDTVPTHSQDGASSDQQHSLSLPDSVRIRSMDYKSFAKDRSSLGLSAKGILKVEDAAGTTKKKIQTNPNLNIRYC